MKIGETIKYVRKKKNLSLAAAGELIGMTAQQLSKLERANDIKVSTVKKIAAAYEIPPVIIAALAHEEGDVPKKKRAIFRELKPLIDKMINELVLNDDDK